MSKNFKKLFQPKSLAIVGGYWADFVVQGNRKLGFKGPIWRINPNRKSNKKNKYFKNIKKDILELHIAHNEGNYFTDKRHLEELENNDLIPIKYCNKTWY